MPEGAVSKAAAPPPAYPYPSSTPVFSAGDQTPAPAKKAATVFAILPSSSGPVLGPATAVDSMLRADWALFLELTTYALYGLMDGRVAFGIEEVSEAIAQKVVAVLFIPVSCGHGGEAAVRGVATLGGRGYIVGSAHELFEDVDDWGAAAILRHPLVARPLQGPGQQPTGAAPPKAAPAERPPGTGDWAAEAESWPEDKRRKLAEAEPAEQQAQTTKTVEEKDLRHELKNLGKVEALQDKSSIPRVTQNVRELYLPQLGPSTVFSTFADVFKRAKGVAHRKALVYVVDGLLMGKGGSAMRPKERRITCVVEFFLRIGEDVSGFKTDEREAYVKLVGSWTAARVLLPKEMRDLKDAWDMD